MMSREEYAGIPGIHDEKPPESGQELPKGNRSLFVREPFGGCTTKENNRDAQNHRISTVSNTIHLAGLCSK
jgi:hypothetical protein